jgi:hypothetical protein
MASFQDLQTIANDAAFRGRCMYALTVAAVANINSAGPTTPLVAYCTQVLQGAVTGYQVALTVLTNVTIAAEATTASLPGCTSVSDSDIQFAVNSLFNALAGIPTNAVVI